MVACRPRSPLTGSARWVAPSLALFSSLMALSKPARAESCSGRDIEGRGVAVFERVAKPVHSVACTIPVAPTFSYVPPADVSLGETYVVNWRPPGNLDPDGSYVIERSADPSFATLLDSQAVSRRSASFVAIQLGEIHHRVRAVAPCDPPVAGPDSVARAVRVVPVDLNVIFTVLPRAVVTTLGEPLENYKTTFAIENVGTTPVQLMLFNRYLSDLPFFRISDPLGGNVASITLPPRTPRTFEIRFSGPPYSTPASYEGLIGFIRADFSPWPEKTDFFAYVNLKVGGTDTAAAPQFRMNGHPIESAFFPGFSGTDVAGGDVGREPIEVEIFNPGDTPMDLGAEIEPEVWLKPEHGWNSSPIPPRSKRTVRLYTQRSLAPLGSPLPVTRSSPCAPGTAGPRAYLVHDNDALPLAQGRPSQLGAGVEVTVVPFRRARDVEDRQHLRLERRAQQPRDGAGASGPLLHAGFPGRPGSAGNRRL